MSDQTTGGDDTIVGGAGGKNQLVGDAETINADAKGGNDIMVGGAGALSNELVGDAIHMAGKGGNDTLVSAAHTSDDMWGDAMVMFAGAVGGADKFVFAPENGSDQINDFSSGTDHIDLTAYAVAGIHSINDLNITSDGTNSVIAFDANDSITVLHVHTLASSDFFFA